MTEAAEAEARPARRRAPVVTVASWLVVGGFAVWALVRVFGLEGGYPFAQLVSFTPYVAGAAVLVPPVALLLRRWPALRVMSANLLEGGADPAALVALVRDQRVDLLALQEFTPEAERALDGAGLAALLPQRVSDPQPGVAGSALYSRFPLHNDGIRLNTLDFQQARGTVSVPGAAPLEVESVHTCSPYSAANTRCWQRSFRNEPPATVDGQVRLLIGDFNATLDHTVLRDLIATGYRDAGDVAGEGLSATWPYDKLFPRITIDHVLADRRIGVRRFAVHPVPRTDHRSVFAELVLPPG